MLTDNPYLEATGHLPGVPWPGSTWQSYEDAGFHAEHEIASEIRRRDASRLSDRQISTLAFYSWAAGRDAWDARQEARAKASAATVAARKPAKVTHAGPSEHQLAAVLAAVVRPIVARIKALEERAESRPGMKYCGVFSEGVEHSAGDAVTFGGSLWMSLLNHNFAVPGRDGSVGWQLAVKKGADGRDAKEAR